MRFTDRVEAGRRLAEQLAYLRGEDVVVLGLPRGGVVVAAEVARGLGAPLDVIVVRKLGVPYQPELAMGAVGEGGIRVLNPDVLNSGGVTGEELASAEEVACGEVTRRVERLRRGADRVRWRAGPRCWSMTVSPPVPPRARPPGGAGPASGDPEGRGDVALRGC
jgi:predicted phosphoribosyltransferase